MIYFEQKNCRIQLNECCQGCKTWLIGGACELEEGNPDQLCPPRTDGRYQLTCHNCSHH